MKVCFKTIENHEFLGGSLVHKVMDIHVHDFGRVHDFQWSDASSDVKLPHLFLE